jgi:site-specific DNA-cytosine methylase
MKPGGLFGYLESIIQQPKDKGLLLKDILQSEVEKKYFLSVKMLNGFIRHAERHNDKGTGFAFKVKEIYEKANCLRANAALCPTDNMVYIIDCKFGFYTCMNYGIMCDSCGEGENYEENYNKETVRRLTPIECERLQTVKDNYTTSASDSQRYKMLGNGWTVDVIAHIFSYLNK